MFADRANEPHQNTRTHTHSSVRLYRTYSFSLSGPPPRKGAGRGSPASSSASGHTNLLHSRFIANRKSPHRKTSELGENDSWVSRANGDGVRVRQARMIATHPYSADGVLRPAFPPLGTSIPRGIYGKHERVDSPRAKVTLLPVEGLCFASEQPFEQP